MASHISVEYKPSTWVVNPEKVTWWRQHSYYARLLYGGSGEQLTFVFVGAWEDEDGNEA